MKPQEENGDDADDFLENSNDILRGSKFEQSYDHEDETDSNKIRREPKKQSDKRAQEKGKEKPPKKKENIQRFNVEKAIKEFSINESIDDHVHINSKRESGIDESYRSISKRTNQKQSINLGDANRVNTSLGTQHSDDVNRMIVIETSNAVPQDSQDPEKPTQLKTIQI